MDGGKGKKEKQKKPLLHSKLYIFLIIPAGVCTYIFFRFSHGFRVSSIW